MANPAREERAALCDLLIEVGPDAPTLCAGWTTRDLAVHLVVREHRPDGVIGMAFKPTAGYGEKVHAAEAERDYAELVERLRNGPPKWSPLAITAVDRLANTIEFFVHHEDVRRAAPTWTPRNLSPELEDGLYRSLSRGARLIARKAPAGLVLEPVGHQPIVAKRAEGGAASVTARGPIGELVLFAYGRQAHADVALDGPGDAVAAMRAASLGI